jgi:alkylation response protein AidB-like acyl-CoA dehydrogenase
MDGGACAKGAAVTLECREGYDQHVEWERRSPAATGAWSPGPNSIGGRGLDLIQWLIFEEEYFRAGGPNRANQNGIFLLGPTIMEFGTDEQKARFLPPMAQGEVIWAQAWSEPGAGSDMAAIQSKAVRDGDHYVITGQKTWSSRAAFADWGFGIFRTDPDSKRHKG